MISANRVNTQRRSGLTKTLSIVATTLLVVAFLFAGRHTQASAAAVSPLAGLASIEDQAEQSKPLLAGMRKKMKRGRLQRQQRRVRQRARVKQQQPRQLKNAARKKKKIRAKAAGTSLADNNSTSTKPSPVSAPETDNTDSGGLITGAGSSAGESTDGPNLTATPRTNENIGTQIGQYTDRSDHGGNHGHGQNGNGPNGSPDGHGNYDNTSHDNQNDNGDWQPNHDQADNRPNSRRPGPHVVCLGGRVLNGRCGCGVGRALRRARKAVLICANKGGTAMIPSVSNSTQSSTTENAQSPDEGTPNQGNQQPPVTTATLPPFVPDEVLVVVNPETPETVDEDVAQTYGLGVAGRWPLEFIGTRLVLYRITDGRTVETVTAQLQGDTRITGPQPNYYYSAQATPKSSSNHDAASQLQYALAKLDIGRAHRITTGRDILIAVIDSKIDETHPELSDVLADQFDATSGTSAKNSDHGTAIAGIISARGILRGIAPGARLLGVSALIPAIDGSAAATTATLMRGLNWAIGKEADVINLSLTGPQDDLVEQGVTSATDQGSIVVAAAGNMGPDAPPVYPAAYEDVIAVTATDVNDRLYPAANHGNFIDIAAPGVDILAPSLGHAHLLKTGTSFAAAHITGIIALLLERDPTLGLDQIRRVLNGTAIDLGPDGEDEQFGAGNANAFAALTHLETDKSTESDLHRLSRMLSSQ